MIRRMEPSDRAAVLALWLEANEQAHGFVPQGYWRDRLDEVGAALAQATVLVFVGAEGDIEGFLGRQDSYLAGLFVAESARGKGIGKQLLDRAKQDAARLTLTVYQNNGGAARFYRREGFAVLAEQVDAGTGQAEWVMGWPAP